jgi:hypothetical protein
VWVPALILLDYELDVELCGHGSDERHGPEQGKMILDPKPEQVAEWCEGTGFGADEALKGIRRMVLERVKPLGCTEPVDGFGELAVYG